MILHIVAVYSIFRFTTVTRTIRQLSWTAPKTPKGRPANFSINAAILKVLNGDPAASMRGIAQQDKLST
jgi:hypothetical protein